LISNFERKILKKVLLKDRPELKDDFREGLKIDFDNFGEYYEDSPDQAIYDSIKITIQEVINIFEKWFDNDEAYLEFTGKEIKDDVKRKLGIK